MARLPNAEKAAIDSEKLHDYIPSFATSSGTLQSSFLPKAGVFHRKLESLRITSERADPFPRCSRIDESRYGQKFIVEGIMVSPTGKKVQIITVWVILKGESIPRFITAYPGGLG